jgi:hypothetical protein
MHHAPFHPVARALQLLREAQGLVLERHARRNGLKVEPLAHAPVEVFEDDAERAFLVLDDDGSLVLVSDPVGA